MAKIIKWAWCFVSPPGCDLGTEGWAALRPFFFAVRFSILGQRKCAGSRRGPQVFGVGRANILESFTVQLTEIIETTVSGLGCELVDIERAGGDLLRISIDQSAGIAIEDCEKVTRQLQYLFEVENIDYSRLEVGSPGLDRPLKKLADFERFAGSEVAVTLKKLLDGRKSYRGILHAPDGESIGLEGKDGGAAMLDFTLADLDKARLVPKVDFRSRKQ
ncbi:MAG: Bacterial ribosome SSU maturation protein RimP [uncultured Caballeronia sp.]|nr:MAG: Bacterial ribosome SSU maturation protein RimP [uncultured Caballeronia sp.]